MSNDALRIIKVRNQEILRFQARPVGSSIDSSFITHVYRKALELFPDVGENEMVEIYFGDNSEPAQFTWHKVRTTYEQLQQIE